MSPTKRMHCRNVRFIISYCVVMRRILGKVGLVCQLGAEMYSKSHPLHFLVFLLPISIPELALWQCQIPHLMLCSVLMRRKFGKFGLVWQPGAEIYSKSHSLHFLLLLLSISIPVLPFWQCQLPHAMLYIEKSIFRHLHENSVNDHWSFDFSHCHCLSKQK